MPFCPVSHPSTAVHSGAPCGRIHWIKQKQQMVPQPSHALPCMFSDFARPALNDLFHKCSLGITFTSMEDDRQNYLSFQIKA
jgi:hypothetical protein